MTLFYNVITMSDVTLKNLLFSKNTRISRQSGFNNSEKLPHLGGANVGLYTVDTMLTKQETITKQISTCSLTGLMVQMQF